MIASKRTRKSKSSSSRRRGSRIGSDTDDQKSDRQSGDRATVSSTILHLIGSSVGDSLSETVANISNRVAEQAELHGQEFLDTAHDRITDVTTKVVKWGKEHPVKTVAAAAALIAVSGFLYATLQGKAIRQVKGISKKLKSASGSM